jgi:zinc transport system substrate-binding protein
LKKILTIALLFLVGCGQGQEVSKEETREPGNRLPIIYTVNYPLAWMAQQLTGDAAAVVFPAPAGVDPAFWQPDVDTVLQYQQADLVLLSGGNYARWIANVSLPANRLVDTSAAYREQLLTVDSGPVHSHGPGGEHSHGELAFTTWLDLDLAQQQLQAVAAALQRLLPAESAAIEQRRASLQRELGSMDARLTALGRLLGNIPVLYSHPVYQYLQRRYHLNGRALHWEPGQAPDEAQWGQLTNILHTHPAQIMLWEQQPLPEVQARLAELGVKTLVFSPMGNRPSSGDFASGMTANIDRLEQLSGIDASSK